MSDVAAMLRGNAAPLRKAKYARRDSNPQPSVPKTDGGFQSSPPAGGVRPLYGGLKLKRALPRGLLDLGG